MKDRPHDDAMAEEFREDPAYAVEFLNTILQDGDKAELLIALRQMAKAFGGMQAIAEKANLNPIAISRMLSSDWNSGLTNIFAILRAMGMRLVVKQVKAV